MEHEFWHSRWEANDIGFHEVRGNTLLKEYFPNSQLEKEKTVFVPLCGKTKDINWLLSNGYKVVGVELSEMAVQQLFSELGAMPQIESIGQLKRYFVKDLSIFVGDFFALTPEILGKVHFIVDRAALVALPSSLRTLYHQHLTLLTDCAPQFLICYEYDQTLFDGPPFSVSTTDILSYYSVQYEIKSLNKSYVKGGFAGVKEVYEVVYQLSTK